VTFGPDPDPDLDPRIRISKPMDPDPDSDPTSFFIDFKIAKKLFLYFFLISWPEAHHLQSKKINFLLNFCVKILFCRHYFNTLMRKGKDPEPDPDLYL
jgi:hypothetical protein